MNWQRTVNEALVRFTGFQLRRVGTSGSAGVVTPAVAAEGLVRPPADPEADRLLRAPVFILSPVRSGSTLLRAMLGAHSVLHAPHELHVRRLTVGFGNSLSKQAMAELGHNQADLEHLLWDRVLHRELVRSGKSVIVEKTPANAFAFQRIATCWPDARFVFLLRHPASIAASWHEASPDKRTPQEAALDALRYMKAVQRARRALPGLTIRYEDLTADPEAETRRICDFLAVGWEPGMLAYGRPEVVRKGLGDWKDKIRSGTVQPGRDLPDPDTIPEVLRPICRIWEYLPEEGGGPNP
ncbi:sulfotransferase family protein [Planomonospora parontospora]|uniref:sulfotransferase family protein n=1 Tax=Planomonospora parontospora TaxID=58119 RepID=UPI0016706FA3|nr:sulfotransferase [Planomonospora parontospora]GGL27927.1 sulfotransferase family protein [Planomonospora parontospora subsp. antibiotica]GII16463.1 sulfotransferase family protein [Planomonospora parontospora subsp. antibiotica]